MINKLKALVPQYVKNKIVGFYNKRNFYYYNNHFINYVCEKYYAIHCHKSAIRTLALRGSNSDFGFDPSEFPNSFNLGLTSSDLYTSYYIYKNLHNDLSNLENLIIYFSVASSGLNLSMTKERYRSIAYHYFFNVPIRNEYNIDQKIKNKIIRRCVKHKNKFNTNKSSLFYGYTPYEGCHNIFDTCERARTHLRENRRVPNQLRWLEKTISLADKNNTKTYIVITPMRSDYKKALPPGDVLFANLTSYIDAQYILDFYNDNDFDDTDMYDTDHLNSKGAKKLTRKIFNRINQNNESTINTY